MPNDFLKRFNNRLDGAIQAAKDARMDEDRRRLLTTVGQDVAQLLLPVIHEMAQSAKINKEEMRDAMFELIGNVSDRHNTFDNGAVIAAIKEAFTGIKMPEPKVTITSPTQKMPDLVWPDEMNIRGFAELMGIFKNSGDNPISVQLRDHKGNPLNLLEGLTFPVSGGGGGGGNFPMAAYDAANQAIKVSGSFSISASNSSTQIIDSSGNAVSAANPLPVTFTGAAGTSVSLVNSDGAYYNSDNALPVTFAANTMLSTITSTDAVATQPLPAMLSKMFGFNGTSWDRIRTGTTGAGGFDSGGALRVTQATDIGVSVSATQVGTWTVTSITNSVAASLVDSGGVQYSGSNPVPVTGTVVVSSITASTATNLVDSTGVAYSGSNPVPVTGTVTVGSITNTIAALLIDSGGVGYSGSNPVPITIVSGALTSTLVVGDSAARSADNGGNPVKVGGLARQTNPSAYADGDRSNFSTDDVGRQLIRPLQVRDLILTSNTAITNGTEATLLTAAAGTFADLIYIMAANNSDAAVAVNIRGVSAGNILMTMQVPANGTVGIACPVPLPQDATGNAWTADLPDITGTTVTITALYSKEV